MAILSAQTVLRVRNSVFAAHSVAVLGRVSGDNAVVGGECDVEEY